MHLHRHVCGFYYSQAFADFLQDRHQQEAAARAGELLALDYIRCREGAKAGQAWWQFDWVSLRAIPAEARHRIGTVEIALSRPTLQGLSGHLLHYSGGEVVVKS